MDHDPWALLAIAEAADPPDEIEAGEDGFREFDAPAGWKVALFYDVGELDYIDHFVTPEGAKIKVWPDQYEDQTEWQRILSCWRGVGDLERLRLEIKPPTAPLDPSAG